MTRQYDLGDFYNIVSPHLDPALVSPLISEKLMEIFGALPSLNLVLLETRLGADQQVDLNICVRQYECNLLIQWIKVKNDPGWEWIKSWCEAWADPSLPFRTLIPNIWLVFDVYHDDPKIPVPWIILGFSKLLIDKDVDLALARKALNYLNRSLTEAQGRLLEKIYTHLPPHGFVPGICVLDKSSLKKRGYGNPQSDALRVGIGNFHSLTEIGNYLKKLDWGGDLDFIAKYYSTPISLSSYCHVSLVIGDRLYPQLGIECYLDFKENHFQAKKMLQSLVDEGICKQSKMDALLAWIGKNTGFPHIWSAYPPNQMPAVKNGYVRRWILEVKMIYSPEKPPSAKSYLIFDRIYGNHEN